MICSRSRLNRGVQHRENKSDGCEQVENPGYFQPLCWTKYKIDPCAHMANAGHFQPLPTNLQNRPVRTYGKMQVFSSPNRKKYLENSLKLPTSVCLTKIMLGKNNRLNLYPSLNRPRKRAQKPETSILTVAQLYHVDVHGALVPRPSGGGGGASSRSSAPPPAPASPWHRWSFEIRCRSRGWARVFPTLKTKPASEVGIVGMGVSHWGLWARGWLGGALAAAGAVSSVGMVYADGRWHVGLRWFTVGMVHGCGRWAEEEAAGHLRGRDWEFLRFCGCVGDNYSDFMEPLPIIDSWVWV
jgi:hypothetical protein